MLPRPSHIAAAVSGGAASPVGGKWQSDLTAGHAAALLKMRHRLFLPRSLPQLVFLVSAKQCFTENKRPTFLYILVGQERERERQYKIFYLIITSGAYHSCITLTRTAETHYSLYHKCIYTHLFERDRFYFCTIQLHLFLHKAHTHSSPPDLHLFVFQNGKRSIILHFGPAAGLIHSSCRGAFVYLAA